MHSLALLFASTVVISAQHPAAPIVVREVVRGRPADSESSYTWRRDADACVSAWGRIEAAQLARIRATILAAPEERADLLERVGFTPAVWAANLPAVLASTWPADLPRTEPLVIPPELAHLVAYEHVAPRVRAALLGRRGRMSPPRELEIVIAGDPVIRARSTSREVYMLPWTIEAGDRAWTSDDVEVTRALAPLLDPAGPNRDRLDGRANWLADLWTDPWCWDVIGDDLSAYARYSRRAGYPRVRELFRVESRVDTNGHPRTNLPCVLLSVREPTVLDAARLWWPTREEPGGWAPFLRAHAAVVDALAKRPWLRAWRASSPGNTVETHAVGGTPRSDLRVDATVLPAWKHARLAGAPEYEILLRRKGAWCATLWMSPDDASTLITLAERADGPHGIDALDVVYAVENTPYAVVDAGGRVRLGRVGE